MAALAAAGPSPSASASVAVVIAGERYIQGPRIAQGGDVATNYVLFGYNELFYTVWSQSLLAYKMSAGTYTVRRHVVV
jgi:hypothetical protein